MAYIEVEDTQGLPPRHAVMSTCPDCTGELAVLRVIAGRAGNEYWTLRCTACGGIHLDILTPNKARGPDDGTPPAA